VTNTAIVIARILRREGGVADVGDGKGITRYGQTPEWLEQFNLIPPETELQAAVNYTRWMQILKLDQVCEIDLELGDGLTDFAVHSGHIPSIKALQRVVNAPADGIIGPFTLAAIRSYPKLWAVAILFECQRWRYLGDALASQKKDNRKYARNWSDRSASRIESIVKRI
jgi:lysozyme family protein